MAGDSAGYAILLSVCAFLSLAVVGSSAVSPDTIQLTEQYQTGIDGNGLGELSLVDSRGCWIQAGTDATLAKMQEYASHGITHVYVQAGYWNNSNAITKYSGYMPTDSELNTAITNAHAAGLKIGAWVTSQNYAATNYHQINLSTSGYRSTAVTAITTFLASKGSEGNRFDFFADDVEDWDWSSYSNLVSYFNAAAIACHLADKEYFTAIIESWPYSMGSTLFASIAVDRIQPMLYGNYPDPEEPTKDAIDFVLTYATCPVGLAVHGDGSYQTFASTLKWIDDLLDYDTPDTYLAGFDIFPQGGTMSTFTSAQWLTWDNWPTKNASATTYTITSSGDSHAIIIPLGAVVVNAGGSQIFTYSAATGYHVTQVSVDGTPI